MNEFARPPQYGATAGPKAVALAVRPKLDGKAVVPPKLPPLRGR